MKRIKILILFFIVTGLAPDPSAAQQGQENQSATSAVKWQKLHKGMEFGVFRSPQPSALGDSLIRIVRIDPEYFEFKLLMASAIKNGKALTVKQWCRQNGLVAGINASMYQTDYKTSVSLMRTKTHINNPRLSKDKTILAFDRIRPDVPRVKMIDRQCEDFNLWEKKYGTLIQSIRMISCRRENVWRQQSKKWSTAAIGLDHQNRVLLIHAGAPHSTHDLINILKQLPLNIARSMYCEGGPQAQLYARSDDKEYEFVGGFELNDSEALNSPVSWPIPNVVGISMRK